jgi:GGDEF domain-containing protein
MRQRILEGLREHNQLELNEFKISVSIGCSTVEKGGMLEEGFKLADERMYLEKQTRKKNTLKN